MTSRSDHSTSVGFAQRFLAAHPRAHVSALDAFGFFTAMPPSVPLLSHQVLEPGASGTDLVVPEDVARVVLAWEELREQRSAVARVRLLADSERPVDLHFFDVSQPYGILLGVVVGADDLELHSRPAGVLRARVFEMRVDQLGHVLGTSPEAHPVLGWTGEQLHGQRDLAFLHPDDVAGAVATWMSMLSEVGSRRRTRLRFRHADGHYVWLESTNHNLLDHPQHRCVVMERVDISEEVASREALQASEQLMRTLAESLPLGVAQVDLRRSIVYRNSALAQVLGQDGAEDLDHQMLGIPPADRSRICSALDAVLARGESSCLEVTVDGAGQQRQVEVKLQALNSRGGMITGAVICVVDITDPVRMREALRRQATFDELTGCHNRGSILDVLQQALGAATAGRGTAAVFLDVDAFKQINDTHRHDAGDDALRAVAAHLMRLARAADVVGRVGGDEFIVVCRDVSDAGTAERIRERISGSLPIAVTSGAAELTVTLSVGVSWTPGGSGDAEAVIAAADGAMYEAKRRRQAEPVRVAHL